MTLVDLCAPTPVPAGILDALPRRLALTRAELGYVAAAVGAPLPFAVPRPRDGEVAYDDALSDPGSSLARRGLVRADGSVEAGLLGAVGLLAGPGVAVDLEVIVAGGHGRAWHRHRTGAVATLATADGLVFEIAWFPAVQWPIELARIAALPEDSGVRDSAVPALLELPYDLADAAVEAIRSDRGDLLTVLAGQHGPVTDPTGAPLDPVDASAVLRGLVGEARGRLRALITGATRVSGGTVGIVSWTLLADGWHALRLHRTSTAARLEVRRVDASDLAADLAPALAAVTP